MSFTNVVKRHNSCNPRLIKASINQSLASKYTMPCILTNEVEAKSKEKNVGAVKK